jgi:hypothetical protein
MWECKTWNNSKQDARQFGQGETACQMSGGAKISGGHAKFEASPVAECSAYCDNRMVWRCVCGLINHLVGGVWCVHVAC